MRKFITSFERINFGFKPALRQSADVLFAVVDDASDDEIDEAAWDAMWAQNPHWKNPAPPLPDGLSGWSSVLGGYEYRTVGAATPEQFGRK